MAIAIIAIVAAMVALIGATGIGVAHAGGFADGKAQAREDSQNGIHNDHCGYERSLSYCAAYRLGYEAGWTAEVLLHDR